MGWAARALRKLQPEVRPRVLLLGSGSSRERRVAIKGDPPGGDWKHADLVRLDVNTAHEPDVVHDLEVLPYPFEDDEFDRIDAYEILEHLGRQGDYRTFFAQFQELWRILKPEGHLAATCPSYRSLWAWGDPSHTRVLCSGSLVFLSQAEYARQVGKTPMSDFRFCYRGDFEPVWIREDEQRFVFVLQAIKPARRT